MEHVSHLLGEHRLIRRLGDRLPIFRRFRNRNEASEPQGEKLPEQKSKVDPKAEALKREREAEEKTKSLKKQADIKKDIEAKKAPAKNVPKAAPSVTLTQQEVEEAAVVDVTPYADLKAVTENATARYLQKKEAGTLRENDVHNAEAAILAELGELNARGDGDPNSASVRYRDLENLLSDVRTERNKGEDAGKVEQEREARYQLLRDASGDAFRNFRKRSEAGDARLSDAQRAEAAILAELGELNARGDGDPNASSVRYTSLTRALASVRSERDKLEGKVKAAETKETDYRAMERATDEAIAVAIKNHTNGTLKLRDVQAAESAILAEMGELATRGDAGTSNIRYKELERSLANVRDERNGIEAATQRATEKEARYRAMERATDEAMESDDRAAAETAIRTEMAELESRGTPGVVNARYRELSDALESLAQDARSERVREAAAKTNDAYGLLAVIADTDTTQRNIERYIAAAEDEMTALLHDREEGTLSPAEVARLQTLRSELEEQKHELAKVKEAPRGVWDDEEVLKPAPAAMPEADRTEVSPEAKRADEIEKTFPSYKTLGYLAAALDPMIAKQLGLSDDVRAQLEEFSVLRAEEAPWKQNNVVYPSPADLQRAINRYQSESEKEGLKLLDDNQRAKLLKSFGDVVGIIE